MLSNHLRPYDTLEGFYLADPRRIASAERDVGLWWRDRPDDPLHRAAWVKDTGELYVARLGPSPLVEVLAVFDSFAQVEELLPGWRERCGEPGSVSWLRRRTAGRPLDPPRPAAFDQQSIAQAIGAHHAVRAVRDIRACSSACCSPPVSARVVAGAGEDCHGLRRDVETMQVDHADDTTLLSALAAHRCTSS